MAATTLPEANQVVTTEAMTVRWASARGGGKVGADCCGEVSEGGVGELAGRSGDRLRGERSCSREVDDGSGRPVLPSQGDQEGRYEFRCRSFT